MMLYWPSFRGASKTRTLTPRRRSFHSRRPRERASLVSTPPGEGKQDSGPYHSLHQQRGNAAGAVTHGEHARARLAAGSHLRDIDAHRRKPRPGRVDVGDTPAQTPELVLVRMGVRPGHDFDNEIAAAEEHQPAPIRMRTVQRHVQPEPRTVERGCALRIR